MKKYFAIISIAFLAASYFLYQYRTKQILEKRNSPTEIADENKKYNKSPLKGEIRDLIYDFWKETERDTIQAITTNNISIIGKEHPQKQQKTIYIIQFVKEGNAPALKITEAKRFDRAKAKSYTYLDESLIVYYGGEDNIGQTMIDTTKMSDSFDLIQKYQEAAKHEGNEFKPVQKIYPLN